MMEKGFPNVGRQYQLFKVSRLLRYEFHILADLIWGGVLRAESPMAGNNKLLPFVSTTMLFLVKGAYLHATSYQDAHGVMVEKYLKLVVLEGLIEIDG